MMDVDDYLMLSGIQHFAFCKRQWALIHIEQIWADNVLTFQGHLFHERTDDPNLTERRGNIIISRALPIVSHKLSLYGVADVVEFHRSETGVRVVGEDNLYQIIPVEYKSGTKNYSEPNELQLCAQALCLGEMFLTTIEFGYLFYGKRKRREKVLFQKQMKERVYNLVAEMYEFHETGITPPPQIKGWCNSCSLRERCMPAISNRGSAREYMKLCLNED
jgi:CRISPR-associated exonuclease Cas4